MIWGADGEWWGNNSNNEWPELPYKLDVKIGIVGTIIPGLSLVVRLGDKIIQTETEIETELTVKMRAVLMSRARGHPPTSSAHQSFQCTIRNTNYFLLNIHKYFVTLGSKQFLVPNIQIQYKCFRIIEFWCGRGQSQEIIYRYMLETLILLFWK